ncbi:MAG: VIT domain-containing protein, partial [Planctomycetota bacterium]
MTPLRVFWVTTLLLLLPSLAFGQSLRNVRPHTEPAGPGKVNDNPGRAVGAGNPRTVGPGRYGQKTKQPAIPRPDGPTQPGGCAPRDPRNPGAPPAAPALSNIVYLQKHIVTVTVADGIASTEIEQTFVNEADRQMEAAWNCPLPPRTVLHGFSIWMGGKEVHAAVMNRTAARRIYDRIVGRRKDPGLVELIGGNTIRTSIFPIPPKGEFRIRTRYSSVVDGDRVVLPFPDTTGTRKIAVVKADLVYRSSRPVYLRSPKAESLELTRRD